MSATAAAPAVTREDITQYVNMDLELVQKNSLTEDFSEHKFSKANAGLTIAHTIVKDFINAFPISTQPGSKPTSTNEDLFTMVRVLAKSNAAILIERRPGP